MFFTLPTAGPIYLFFIYFFVSAALCMSWILLILHRCTKPFCVDSTYISIFFMISCETVFFTSYDLKNTYDFRKFLLGCFVMYKE